AQRDLVAHAEGVDEQVDLAAVDVVVVEAALTSVHGVEGDVGLVAGSLEELVGRTPALLRHREVDVLVRPVERRRHRRRLHAYGNATEEPQRHPVPGRDPEQALTLGDDVLEDLAHWLTTLGCN